MSPWDAVLLDPDSRMEPRLEERKRDGSARLTYHRGRSVLRHGIPNCVFKLGFESASSKTSAFEHLRSTRRYVEVLRVTDEAVELREDDLANGFGPAVGLTTLDFEEYCADLGVQLLALQGASRMSRPTRSFGKVLGEGMQYSAPSPDRQTACSETGGQRPWRSATCPIRRNRTPTGP